MFNQVGRATIDAYSVRKEGIFADLTCIPVGEQLSGRVCLPSAGDGYGMHFPYSVGDEVLYACPEGDPGDGVWIIGRYYEVAMPPPQVIQDNPDDEQWVAKSQRKLALWTGQADLWLTVDTNGQGVLSRAKLAADGTISFAPAAGKYVLVGSEDDPQLAFLCKKGVYDALVTFAAAVSVAANVGQVAAAGNTLNSTLLTPPLPLTTVAKAL